MREKNFNSQNFFIQLEKQVTNSVAFQRILELRSQVVNSSNLQQGISFFSNLPRKLDQLECLAAISYYFPKEVGFPLREDIREKLREFSLEDQVSLKLILQSEQFSKNFLIFTQKWSSRDFFGNILRNTLKQSEMIKFKKIGSWKVKKPQRKRGYHDHGNLVPIHKKDPNKYIDFTSEQNRIEEERLSSKDTFHFLKGFLL